MKTLKFSINVKAVDCYIYSGYLFLALEDGNLGYIPMCRIMCRLNEKYPEFQSLLRMAFERNDYFSNETGKTFLGIPQVMDALKKLWILASKKMEFSVDFKELEDDFNIIDKIPSFPILDIKMYAMTLFVGCKDGLYESPLNVKDNKYSINPSHLRRKFDAKVVGLNASCGSVVVSAGEDGLFFGPFEMDKGITMNEHAVEDVSYRTSWSSTDIVNYKSASYFDYLISNVERYEDKPLFSKFDERYERKRIVKINDYKYEQDKLLGAEQFAADDILYAFNGTSSSFVITRDGFYNMNFVKDANDIHLSSKVNELSLFGKRRKAEKPISASVVPAGCVIEFFDNIVAVRGNRVVELEKEPAYSVRTYMNSYRYRNLVSVTKQDCVSIHSLNPFSTYDFASMKKANEYIGNDLYAFRNGNTEDLPF